MNTVSRPLSALILLVAFPVMAETTAPATATPITAPATTPAAPAAPIRVTTPPVATRPTPAVAPSTPTAAAPAAATAPKTVAPATSPVFENILNTVPEVSPEQRRQQEMLVNAERVDKANRELLARNQELQLQTENLSIQNSVLKRDRSNEGIWKGAGAVIVGFLMGWFFAGVGRRKSNW
jgi:hypothetical protein